jgi:hypothetical protein
MNHDRSILLCRNRGRDGSITLEVALILPLLVLLTIATIQFAVFTTVEQAVVHAATVAAREAAKGASVDELVRVVETVLAPHGVSIPEGAAVRLEDPQADSVSVQVGSLPCEPAATPAALVPGEIRVTVSLDMGKKPFLNALKYIGIDHSGQPLSISSLAKKST